MRGLGYVLAVIAALLAVVGLIFVFAAGGNEPEPIRATGVYILALAVAIGLAATFTLRSGKAK